MTLPLAHHLVEAIPFVTPALLIPAWLGVIVLGDRRKQRRERL